MGVAKVPDDIEIELKHGKIIYTETGSYTMLPMDTVKIAERVLGKIGVVKTEQIPLYFTDGVPIFRINEALIEPICHRQACYFASPPTTLDNPPRENFGKGMTVEQSKVSAMMEAVERYCGQQFPHSRTADSTYEIPTRKIFPSEFTFPSSYSPQCERCMERNKACFQELESVCQEWSWGYSITKKEPVLVPSAVVYYPYISRNGISFIFNDTTGLSAGNTLEEAILQGLAEVIERDALYYAFNLAKLSCMPVVDLSNSTSRFIQKFLNKSLPANVIFAFKIGNETLQHNIPAFTAFICYQTHGRHLFFGGSGAGLDPKIALLRALTELEQHRIRQKVFVRFDPNKLVHHGNLWENADTPDEIPSQSTGDVKSDIELYVERLLKTGVEVIVVNLTHPDIGIPVVRVIVPKFVSYSGLVRESVSLSAIETVKLLLAKDTVRV